MSPLKHDTPTPRPCAVLQRFKDTEAMSPDTCLNLASSPLLTQRDRLRGCKKGPRCCVIEARCGLGGSPDAKLRARSALEVLNNTEVGLSHHERQRFVNGKGVMQRTRARAFTGLLMPATLHPHLPASAKSIAPPCLSTPCHGNGACSVSPTTGDQLAPGHASGEFRSANMHHTSRHLGKPAALPLAHVRACVLHVLGACDPSLVSSLHRLMERASLSRAPVIRINPPSVRCVPRHRKRARAATKSGSKVALLLDAAWRTSRRRSPSLVLRCLAAFLLLFTCITVACE